MSAKVKIVSSIGAMFLMVILIVTLTSFFNFKSASTNNYKASLNDNSFLIGNAIEQKMSRYFDSLNIVSDKISINADGSVNLESLKNELGDIENKLGVLAVYVGLKSGVTYLPSGEISNFNAKSLDREWYKRIFSGEKNIITKPYTSSAGNLVMALAIPVIRNNEIVAVLAANLAVDDLTKYIATLSDNNQLWVTREDGFILAGKDPKYIGKNLFELRPSYSQYKDEISTHHTYDLEGEQYFVAHSKIPSNNWSVWSWDSMANINQASNDNLVESLITAIVLILISLYVSYFLIMKLIYRPIGGEPTEIEDIVKRISDGDLSIQRSSDGTETGIYSSVLTMVDNLKASMLNINEAAEQLHSSSREISTAAQSISASSSEQMNQLENSSTSMEEMTTTVEDVARNALDASVAAREAHDSSGLGLTIVTEMNNNIQVLVQGIQDVVVVTNKLEAETQSIGSILEVINSISEQTNLLALNAAIEAARAGEHGRGFAVVADEVRNLANRTKESTGEIQNMIHRLQEEAKRSVSMMEQNVIDAQNTSEKSSSAANALDSIQTSIVSIQNQNDQIATAAEEQTHVSTDISQSVFEIYNKAKENFNNSKENDGRSKRLAEIAASLKKTVEFFKL
ncbi:methyl-accepting chemotaxis protein [Marinomonas sp. TI.3.20]|uniref:methyl-accepting chemotaxis protein n=1 Tax=Marinomonas sp. TI.3.20 TaxID=3121296 RepID=UPI00311FF219